MAHTGTVCLHSHVLMEFPVLHLCWSSGHWSMSRILVSIQRKQTPSHPQDSENEAVFYYWKGGFCHHGFPSQIVLNSLRLRGMDRSYAPYVQWLHSAVIFLCAFYTFLISFSTSRLSQLPLILAVPLSASNKIS